MPEKIMRATAGTERNQCQRCHHNKIWTKSFVVAVLVVLALGVISLLTGAYDLTWSGDVFYHQGAPYRCPNADGRGHVHVRAGDAVDYAKQTG